MTTIQMLSAALLLLLLVMGVSLGPLDSDTASAAQLTGEGAHHSQGRSATEERDKWHQCLKKQCTNATCSECGPDDKGCADMCRMKCECGCGGQPRGSMDHDVWEACNQARNCRGDFELCRESCRGNKDCVVRCELDHNQCYCGCMLTTTQRKHNWDTCIVQSQCTNATCNECGPGDKGCAAMCRMNCECGCGGQPRGGMDHDVWEACNQARNCRGDFEVCRESCRGNKDCVVRCELDHNQCYCGCMLTTTQRKHNWDTCIVQSQCFDLPCSECGPDDKGCAAMCRMNCECGCGGHPRGGMDHDVWKACNEESKCRGDFEVCRDSCRGNKDCVVRCELDHNQCYCGCVHTALTATQRKHNWDTCIVRSQCTNATCSECGPDDKGCADMCRMNCECGCGGHPRGGMDHDVWEACNQERECWHNFEGCRDSCEGDHECVVRCELVHNKCYCECVQMALTTTQRKHDWDTCVVQCQTKTCTECTEADGLCAKICARSCECTCARHPWIDLSGEWEECFVGKQSCEEAHSDCLKGCHEQECRHGCDLALVECRCVCRSATEAEWLMWTECKEKDECGRKTCSECGEDDTDCAHRCQRNCECRRCLGIPADNMDDLSVQECKIKSGCHIAYKKCQEKCKAAEGDEECDHSCLLASEKCHCKCAQTSATETSEGERREIIQHCNYLG